MAVTIESLLEENLGKAQELQSAADATFEDVTLISHLGERIESQFESVSSSALSELQSLQATIASLEAAFEQMQQQADGKLNEATELIEQVQQQSSSAVEQVLAASTNVKTLLSTADSQLEEKAGTVEERLQKLTAGAGEYKSAVESATEKTGQLSQQFESKLTTALGEIEGKKTEAVSEIDSLQTQLQTHVDEVVRSISEGTEATQQKLTQTVEGAKATSKSSQGKLDEKLAQGSLQTFSEELGDVISAIDIVKNVTESLGIDLGDSVGKVMDDIDEIVTLVRKIKPVLDLADELL